MEGRLRRSLPYAASAASAHLARGMRRVQCRAALGGSPRFAEARATRLWLDSGVVLGARWQAHRHVFVELSAGLWYPIIRDRIRVEPNRIASEAPPLGPSVGVGAGYLF